MKAFVHVLILACWWLENHYVAFQSTRDQYNMEVYVKAASSLYAAMSSTTAWAKQSYLMPWTQILSYFWWDSEGFEAALWSNDYKGERGITIGYRWFQEYTRWYYAKLEVPGCIDKWSCMYLKQDSMLVHNRLLIIFCVFSSTHILLES